MWPALPASEYYGGSATSGPSRRTTRLPTADLAGQPMRYGPDASHVHRVPVGGVGAQLCPCGLAVSTPQTFLTASRPDTSPDPEVTHRTRWACTAPRPLSTRFEPAYLLRGFTRWFLTYTFPPRLADPGRLAVPARPAVVAAAPTLPGVSPLRLPPASPARCDGPATKVSHLHPVNTRRLVAHEVPDPGVGPDRADPAAATGAGRAALARLRPAR